MLDTFSRLSSLKYSALLYEILDYKFIMQTIYAFMINDILQFLIWCDFLIEKELSKQN